MWIMAGIALFEENPCISMFCLNSGLFFCAILPRCSENSSRFFVFLSALVVMFALPIHAPFCLFYCSRSGTNAGLKQNYRRLGIPKRRWFIWGTEADPHLIPLKAGISAAAIRSAEELRTRTPWVRLNEASAGISLLPLLLRGTFVEKRRAFTAGSFPFLYRTGGSDWASS